MELRFRNVETIECTADISGASRDVVLLIPGTTLDPGTNFDGNWFPALDKLDWPYCSVALPDGAMNDIQVSLPGSPCGSGPICGTWSMTTWRWVQPTTAA